MAKKLGVNKRKDGDYKKNKDKSSGLNMTLVLASIIVILLGALSYQVFVHITTIPELPPLNLYEWWGPNTTSQDTSVRPFRVMFTEAMQEQLRGKIDVYRSITNKKKSINESWTYGIHSDAVGQIFAHWQFKYKYDERAKFLNKFDHFKTNIQGLDIHFLHVKPKVDKTKVKVIPLLLLHGWPGSIREFYEAIPLLTTVNPGYDFVFEVIAPSLPGFVYSQAPTKPGLNPFKMAVIMRNLMQRLGFTRYFIQGGDFGHSIGSHLATAFPKEVLGFHTNLPANFSYLALLAWIIGGIAPTMAAGDLADTIYPAKDKIEFFIEEFGYMHLQGTKPDTIGIALHDSPLGLAAYIIDRFMIFTDPSNKFSEDGGLLKHYNMTDLLDNIMLYWSTGSIMSSLRIYKESFRATELEQTLARIPTPVPTWALRLRHEITQHPDWILRWKYPNLVGTTTMHEGGHFAAFEKPVDFANDVFLGVKKMMEAREI